MNIKHLESFIILAIYFTFWFKCLQCNLYAESREMLGWKKHKLESRLSGEISITSDMQITPPSDMQMTPPMAESEEEKAS